MSAAAGGDGAGRVCVLVTSDTHLVSGARLPADLLALADRADHVVHAGDLTTLDVLAVLREFAPVTAVHGNVCDAQVSAHLPAQAEVALGGVRFGVVHDAGPAAGRHARLVAMFPGCGVVVYGHSHVPELERASGVGGPLVVNPGSPVQRRRAPRHTAAWLEVGAGEVLAADLVCIDR